MKGVGTLRVVALKYGQTDLPFSMIYQGNSSAERVPISLTVYLVCIGKRKILIDAGCDTMPNFELRHFCGPVAALEQYGLASDDITDVIITHAHHDHIDGMRHFPHATVWIQADEYQKGKHRIPDSCAIRTYQKSAVVTRELRIQCIGGHSVGSSIVLLKRASEVLVFCGDECYLPECLSLNIPTGASRNPKKSRAFIQTYRNPPYRTLLAHDPAILPEANGHLEIL